MALDYTIVLGAFWSVLVLSFMLYKENIAYRFCEYTMIGVAAGHAAVISLNLIYGTNLIPLFRGDFLNVIPLILGIGVLFKLTKKYAWISRFGIAMIVGVGAGDAIRSQMAASFIRQITSTFQLFTINSAGEAFNVGIFMVALITTMSIFLFSIKPEGIGAPLPKIQKLGRLFVMNVLGTVFAHQVMSRIAMLAGVIERVLLLFGR